MRTRGTVITGALALVLGLSGCAKPVPGPGAEPGPGPGLLLDAPVYRQVSALRGSATAVALVRVGPVVAQELNDPEKTAGEPALPVSIYRLTVEESGAAALPAGSTPDLLYFDTGQVQIEGVTPLQTGQELVMFLSAHPDGAPGIESVPAFWSATGQDQGVFDVGPGGTAVARSASVRSIDGESDPQYTDNHLVTTVAALLAVPAPQRPGVPGPGDPSPSAR